MKDNVEMDREKRIKSKSECKESCEKIPDKYDVVKHNCNTRCDALG